MKGHSTGAMYIQLLMLHKRACTFYNKPLAFSGLALKDTFDWVWHLPEVYHWKNFLKDSGWRGFFPAILPFRIVLTLLVFSERCLVDDAVLCHWRRLALCVTSLGFSVFFFFFSCDMMVLTGSLGNPHFWSAASRYAAVCWCDLSALFGFLFVARVWALRHLHYLADAGLYALCVRVRPPCAAYSRSCACVRSRYNTSMNFAFRAQMTQEMGFYPYGDTTKMYSLGTGQPRCRQSNCLEVQMFPTHVCVLQLLCEMPTASAYAFSRLREWKADAL